MAEHTPGPWNSDRYEHCVSGPSPDVLIPVTSLTISGPDSFIVANIVYSETDQPDVGPTCEANARLIAAVPKLLLACQVALKGRCLETDTGFWMDERDPVAVALRAAIEEATGRSLRVSDDSGVLNLEEDRRG